MMALFLATSVLLATGTYAVTFRLRRPVRLLLALAVIIVAAVLPTVLLLLYPDKPLPGARTIERSEIENPAPATDTTATH